MKERYQIILLLVVTFIVRSYVASQTPVIAKDSVLYLQNAIHFSSGEFAKGLEGYPPVYSLLVAIIYSICGNAEYAGQAVSILMGTLSLLPFYFLVRDIFGGEIPWVSSLLFAIHPFLVRYSGEAISEPTYIFFFIFSVWMAWKALKYERTIFYFSFGLLTALAYLTRPEGIGLLFGLFLWLPIHLWFNRKRPSLSLYGKPLFVLLPFLFLVTPYLYKVHEITGEWRLNAKRNMILDTGFRPAVKAAPQLNPSNSLLNTENNPTNRTGVLTEDRLTGETAEKPYRGMVTPKGPLGLLGRYIKTFFLSLNKFTRIFHQFLFFFMLYLLIKKRYFYYNLEGESFLAFLLILYLSAISLLYVSGRHLLQLVPLALPWAAAGLIEFSRIPKISTFPGKREVFGWRCSSQALLLALTIGILLPTTLAGNRTDKLPLREAADWIKMQGLPSPAILSADSRVAFYAQGRHIPMTDMKEFTSLVNNEKPDFVVIILNGTSRIRKDVLQDLKPYPLKEVFRAQTEEGSNIVTVYVLGPDE